MPIVKRLLLTMFVVLACVGCDQSTKALAEAKLPTGQPLSFLSDTLRLQVSKRLGKSS